MHDAAPHDQCTACGRELPPAAKFCPECGHAVAPSAASGAAERLLQATSALEGERKFVTILFADLKGSLELIADRDPEEVGNLLHPVVKHMCEAVEKYGGTVSQVMGDGILALFGAPISWEDHAVRACHAALSMQDLIRHYSDDIQRTRGVSIQIRVGLNSGEVVLNVSGHGLAVSYTAVGLAVHLAARMEQMAKPGTILATAETVRLAAGYVAARRIGRVPVKGFDHPIEVAEIGRKAAPRSRFDRSPARALTPFTGRSGELEALLATFGALLRDGTGRLAVIVGEAGIGKSRLVHEFLRRVARRNVLILDAGGAPYGSGTGDRPGVQILRQYFNIAEGDDIRALQEKVAGRIVALDGDSNEVGVPILALLRALPANHRFFGLPLRERQQRVSAALMWLAHRMTAERPLVLVYEDLQWGTSDTRDFLDLLVQNLPRSTFLLLTYRPDYDAGWLAHRQRLEFDLEGLSPSATRQIITSLLGDDPSLARLSEELPRHSGGNPLFIEEYVRSMVEAGDVAGRPGHYKLGAGREPRTIPPTVRGVLAARIDRLARADKHVLQTLAAVGESARVALLERACALPIEELRLSLRRLEWAGLLVERANASALSYEFKHSLTQAVAYDTLLTGRRQELHRGILAALGGRGEPSILARHAVLGEAWDQALPYLRDAGRAAAAQFSTREAVAHFERALEVLARLPRTRQSRELAFDIHCDLRNVLVLLGAHQQLIKVLESARTLAEELEDERRLAQILSFLSNYYGNVGNSDLALDAAGRVLALGERLQSLTPRVVGNMSLGEIHRTLGNYAKARDYLGRVVELISTEPEQEYFGQVGLPAVRARSHLAWTLAELGEFEAARSIATEGLKVAEASHHAYSLCHACLALGGVWVRVGEFEAAVSILARGLATSEQVPLLRPPIAADLGVAHARCGRIAEGLSHLDAAVEGATTMGRLSRLPLLLVKCGEIHLLAGEQAQAERLATKALALAVEQKERGNEAYARHLLAEVCMANAAESMQAQHEFMAAMTLAAELGMQPLVAHCHAGLGRLQARRGEVISAAEHFEKAADMYRALGMRYWSIQLEGDIVASGVPVAHGSSTSTVRTVRD